MLGIYEVALIGYVSEHNDPQKRPSIIMWYGLVARETASTTMSLSKYSNHLQSIHTVM